MTSNDTATPGTQLERGAGVAVWRQIEQILAAEIAASGFGEDGRLPSEGELAKRFDVNRHTVRRAMLGLAALGLVSVEQGRGTFVRSTIRLAGVPALLKTCASSITRQVGRCCRPRA
jgi:GntR family transcriptional regulator, phosphonate transport system regulatory protein